MFLARTLRKFRLRLRSLLERQAVEQELDEELGFHLERQIEQNLSRGMTPEDARREALKVFGGIEQRKEECRDGRGLNAIESLVKDVQYSLRRLAQHPFFSLAAILTIALGTGVNTALFSGFSACADSVVAGAHDARRSEFQ